jgi:eukaryotic-like serine/threonine-protein kinase
VEDQLRPGDPRRVGPYRLTGWLGGGGMGEVFLGRSAGGRLVAVKVIRPELAADREFRTRFRREVAAARRVNGLYTAMVADADTDGAVPWLATAYVPGPSLEAAVAEHGPLPARSVLALAAGLAEGLDAVHAAGLVHRDVKPSNVLLSADGPRLIDFGIAWDAQSTVLTMAGTIFGSPHYVSPEYATGQEFGPPTDVFSLGAVLVYAATGSPPFQGTSLATIVNGIVYDAPDLSRVPAQARPVIEWCLAKDPAARPTPRQLVARLGDALLVGAWLPEQLLAGIPADRASADRGSPDPRKRSNEPDTQTMLTVPPLTVPPLTVPPQAVPLLTVPPQADPPAASPPNSPDIESGGIEPGGIESVDVASGDVASGAGTGHARPSARTIAAIVVPAVAVIAVAGAGLWLALGHHGVTPKPELSHTATATSTRSAATVGSPYRFVISGAVERACASVLHSAVGGRAASIVFADNAATTVRFIWINYQGSKSSYPNITLKPGAAETIRGDAGDAWQLQGTGGCVADFITAAAARITVEKP